MLDFEPVSAYLDFPKNIVFLKVTKMLWFLQSQNCYCKISLSGWYLNNMDTVCTGAMGPAAWFFGSEHCLGLHIFNPSFGQRATTMRNVWENAIFPFKYMGVTVHSVYYSLQEKINYWKQIRNQIHYLYIAEKNC